MPASTGESQGEGQDLQKRQRCDNGVPISTRYEVSTITTYYVSHSYYTPPPRSTDPLSETPRPAPTTWTYYTFRDPRPPISLEPRTSTTWLPLKKSVVPTTSEVIPKPRAVQGVPVTITHTIVTRVPVETIYSCPPPSSRALPTSWVEPTSYSDGLTSWWTTESTHAPSTRHRPTTSSREPWYHSSSTPSTPTSRSRPTEPPSTSPPPSTRPTSSIPPRTSPAPNSTTTSMPWPPTTTSPSYSECVYTLFYGTVPYGNYTASCTGSTTNYYLMAMQFICSELGNSRAMGPGIMHLDHVQYYDIFDRALQLVFGLSIRLGCGSLHVHA
ncbi:unnamed protein product [Rhizoctonia solani]|uniref:Uncharacterized protein n=1 Tax=Rhizoctonia solani TaxID=456999 RepID=A0A8H2XEN6_9AGAM|nr:unnamed protein product [Rhizoctonia solani]